MGICVSHKEPGQGTSPYKAVTTTSIASKPTRERLSIWKFRGAGEQELSPEAFVQLYNTRRNSEFHRAVSKSCIDKIYTREAEDEEGTIRYLRKVTIDTALSPKRQHQFEEKKVHISGDRIPEGYMSSRGLAVTCRKGLKPESPNQDDYSIFFDHEDMMLGVFDGHGPDGHQVAGFIHKELPKLIAEDQKFSTNPMEVFVSAFQKCQVALETHCDENRTFDCVVSGATATIVLVRGNTLFCAHVGDSRVVLSRKQPNGTRTSIDLTNDHTPTIAEERTRIEQRRGEVKQLAGDITARVFVKGKDFPGLAMSRVLGDLLAQEIGVICEPEIKEYKMTEDDEFLLLCSDGVWEFVSSIEAVQLVARFGRENVNGAVEGLAQEAWNRWQLAYPDTVDDITVLVAYLHPSAL